MSESTSAIRPRWPVDLMWINAASEIVNEQALEDHAHPLMIHDGPFWCSSYFKSASTILEEQAFEAVQKMLNGSQVLSY